MAFEQNVYSKFFCRFPKREHTNKSNSQSNSFWFLAKTFHPLPVWQPHCGLASSESMRIGSCRFSKLAHQSNTAADAKEN